MIRFAWLQFRTQAAAAAVALAILAIALALTGPQVTHLYAGSGIAACHAHGNCLWVTIAEKVSKFLVLAVLAVPAIIGVFWGAPLIAREIESHTYRLAWTQGVTRIRWLAVKLAVVGLASMSAAGLLSLMVTWWTSPLVSAHMNQWSELSERDIIPVGSAAIAFTLGVTAGVLIRRTLPAMAVTLVVFTLAQVLIALASPHFVTPLRTTPTISAASLEGTGIDGSGRLFVQAPPARIPGAWMLSPSQSCSDTASCDVITATGRSAASLPGTKACGSPTAAPQACAAYIATLHLRQSVTYQPAGRYWIFQWYETAIYLAASLILTAICFWVIRRRVT